MKARVLVVMPPTDRDELLQSVAESDFELETVTCCDEARRLLRERRDFDAVVTDLTLCDGNWWSIYQDLTVADSPAEILVVVPRKGANVTEILAHGVFGVLYKPFNREKVLQALRAATAHERVADVQRANA